MGVSWIFNLLAKVFAKVFFVGTLGVLKTHEPQENSEYWSLLVSDNLRLTQLPTKAHGWGSTFGCFTVSLLFVHTDVIQIDLPHKKCFL